MNYFWISGATALTLPAIFLRLTGSHAGPLIDSVLFGLAILGAAFLLTWAAEVAQIDISQSLALALLALIAVLPEYAVDLYFAWAAGTNPEYAQYAVANMTGGNRLLIGIGWPLVVFLFWILRRERGVSTERSGGASRVRNWKSRWERGVSIERSRSTDLVILSVATLYAFTIPLRGSLSLIDTVVLLSLFVVYLWIASKQEQEEPELVGPPEMIARFPTVWRRAATIFLFLFSAAVILSSAEPFAEGLVTTGKRFGIDEFLLVQWLAPLASEAPEIIVAAIFVTRNSATMALGTLVSSKVNQWTLLVGTLALVYSVSTGGPAALPLDARQVEEVFLTAAQSAFAIALLMNFSLSRLEAGVLLFLFLTQLLFSDPTIRYGYAIVYLALTAFILIRDRDRLGNLVSALPWVAREGVKKG